MLIERSVEITRPAEEVFAFVADPQNDPLWCAKVLSVELSEGAPETVGARYDVIHRPVPFRPPREMDYRVIEFAPPEKIVWREDDGHDVFTVTYLLAPSAGGTLFTQRSDAQLGVPKILHPLMRVGIGMDIARQLKKLRDLLEQR